jgi:hypothetical protein
MSYQIRDFLKVKFEMELKKLVVNFDVDESYYSMNSSKYDSKGNILKNSLKNDKSIFKKTDKEKLAPN